MNSAWPKYQAALANSGTTPPDFRRKASAACNGGDRIRKDTQRITSKELASKDWRVSDSVSSLGRPAGFWLRLAAAMIDFIVLAVPFAVFVSFLSVALRISNDFLDLRPGLPPSAILMKFGPRFLHISLGFFLALSWVYFAGLESSAWRATLGKRALSLYVADSRGDRVTFARASGRFLGGRFLAHVPPLGLYYFLVDCLCAGVTPRKQALHDIFARCLVLREPPTSKVTPGN